MSPDTAATTQIRSRPRASAKRRLTTFNQRGRARAPP